MRQGAASSARWAPQSSPGTKTFALTGHVANTGLIEVPFGTTLREIVFDIGGGVIDDARQDRPATASRPCRSAARPAAASTEEHLDLPLDFDSLQGVGAMVGSGGLVVMNEQTCMVQHRALLHAVHPERVLRQVRARAARAPSRCWPCWTTSSRAAATAGTLELLEQLAPAVQKGSLCGLGKTAPNPVLSTLRYFRGEYEAHVFQKRCPAGQCKALAVPEILRRAVQGLRGLLRKCPVGAITGEKKAPHRIDAEGCIKCGACAEACKFDAIVGV